MGRCSCSPSGRIQPQLLVSGLGKAAGAMQAAAAARPLLEWMLVCVPGLWGCLRRDELQALTRGPELRLAHSRGGRDGSQGEPSPFSLWGSSALPAAPVPWQHPGVSWCCRQGDAPKPSPRGHGYEGLSLTRALLSPGRCPDHLQRKGGRCRGGVRG